MPATPPPNVIAVELRGISKPTLLSRAVSYLEKRLARI
jgi:hypothetical protein